MEKPAETTYPIHDLLKGRWSPRAFSDRPVEVQKLRQLFEAARWAASSFNEQPWSFIVVTKDNSADFDQAVSCLAEANRPWAKQAPVLILTTTKRTFSRNDNPNRACEHDLGLAVGNLTVQADALGLSLHQMAGIEVEKIRSTYHVPPGHDPVTAIALGYPGEPGQLPEDWMREAEQAPRTRKPFDEFVFTSKFGQASGLFD